MSTSSTELLLSGENEEGYQAGFSQGVPMNTEQCLPPPAQVWPAAQQPIARGALPNSRSVAQPPPYTPVVTAANVDLRPPSYIIMTFIVAFICFFLNITTLIFGISAIILSIMSEENKKKGEYGTAKTYGKIALGINIANIIYTAIAALAILSGVLGAVISYYRYAYIYYEPYDPYNYYYYHPYGYNDYYYYDSIPE